MIMCSFADTMKSARATASSLQRCRTTWKPSAATTAGKVLSSTTAKKNSGCGNRISSL